jgi:transcriptional regulator with XRE-family HTH domain
LQERFTKLDTDQLRAALADRTIKRVAEATGINYYTLLRFANGQRTPRAHTLDVLRAYMKDKP